MLYLNILCSVYQSAVINKSKYSKSVFKLRLFSLVAKSQIPNAILNEEYICCENGLLHLSLCKESKEIYALYHNYPTNQN